MLGHLTEQRELMGVASFRHEQQLHIGGYLAAFRRHMWYKVWKIIKKGNAAIISPLSSFKLVQRESICV